MKTTEAIKIAQALNPKLTMVELLAITELMRIKQTTIEKIVTEYGSAKALPAVAVNHIADNHIDFKTQTPIHATDCLICGAIKVGA
jgi:hypothetical protein